MIISTRDLCIIFDDFRALVKDIFAFVVYMSRMMVKQEVKYKLTDIPGVGPATATKLKNAGYMKVEVIAMASSRELSAATGITLDTARKIIEAARRMVGTKEFVTAKEYYEERKRVGYITTGSRALDNLLLGGIETKAITEFVGEFGSGKTQICHQLAVNVQLPREMGGLEGKAVYIDTEGTFRAERIIQMAKAKDLDPDKTLENILVARAYNSDHQISLVKTLYNLPEIEEVKLVVVDSLVAHFRSEYPGRENLVTRQQRLNMHVHDLLRLANIYDLAVVVTNQIVSSPDVFAGNPNKPAGGHIVAHNCTYRVRLRKSKRNKRIASIFDSPHHPQGEALFLITEEGITDAPS